MGREMRFGAAADAHRSKQEKNKNGAAHKRVPYIAETVELSRMRRLSQGKAKGGGCDMKVEALENPRENDKILAYSYYKPVWPRSRREKAR